MRRLFYAALAVLAAGGARPALAAGTVTLDPNNRHQTILGWGASSPKIKISDFLRNQILDEAVNDLGLTRLRFEPARREWEDALNDDDDPNHANWAALKTTSTDYAVENWVLPFKQRVEANGDPFNLYVSPSFFNNGSSGTVPGWMLNNPEEYAEWASTLLLYLKQKHNLVADYYCICNEAGNDNNFSPSAVIRTIKALGPRLRAAGLPTKIEFPEGVNSSSSWNYIQAAQNDDGVWPYIGVLTYHLYGDGSKRTAIRDFGLRNGIPTGETEYMGTTISNLFDDLVEGGVSYWEHYGLVYFGSRTGAGDYLAANFNNTSFSRYPDYWKFRQVMHYVRPGAVRIEAACDNADVRAVAFTRAGQSTVVLMNAKGAAAASVDVKGLPAGQYGVCQAVGARPYEEQGIRTLAAGAALTVDVPRDGVVTLYPYAGRNLPPTVTEWQATPNFLEPPQEKVTLSAGATDPEKDALTYRWSVDAQPAGAQVQLATPDAARTDAAGLNKAGDYLFTVAVSDAGHTVKRQVMLTVFPGNQPPVIADVHNRKPVTVILPVTTTELRGGARDLEGDPLTFGWSLVSQPAGAAAVLAAPGEAKCPVSGMNVAGDYVFRFQAGDPTHKVTQDLRVTVYPGITPAGAPGTLARVSVGVAPAGGTAPAPGGAGAGGTGTGVGTGPAGRGAGNVVSTDPPPPVPGDDITVRGRGTTVGVVVAKGPAWVDVKSDTGKVTHFMPEWKGGNPAQGGGPDPAVVAQIAPLRVGDRVTVAWHVNDHVRIESIAKVP